MANLAIIIAGIGCSKCCIIISPSQDVSGVWWGIQQEIVTGPPNYRLQTWLHRSDWWQFYNNEFERTAATRAHTQSQGWRPDPIPLRFSSDFSGWQRCLTSLIRLEWGLRHLGPNQSVRTNAGRGQQAQPCSLYCLCSLDARHACKSALYTAIGPGKWKLAG